MVDDFSEQVRKVENIAAVLGVFVVSAKPGYGINGLSAERWNSYLQIKRGAKFADDKAGFLRQKSEWHKELSKWSKQSKKSRGSKVMILAE